MDKLKMHSRDNVAQNIEAVGRLFPHALTEVMRDGKAVQAIDFDVLRQELSREIVEGREERYAFTWPDKRQAILAANAPIAMTLRPVMADSVGRDGTAGAFDSENLYIEGDNLDVLKLLQETYLGKVKMIYIDPPYNTGNDAFVYDDAFAMADGEFVAASMVYDEYGNQTYDFRANNESNGRFHTDWLNMIYPRLRVAKSLLADDGIIFISIGDEELDNLRKVCDEVFGEANFRNQITIRRGAKSLQAQFESWDKLGQGVEYILLYTRNSEYRFPKQMRALDEKRAGAWNNHWRGTDRPTMRYELFGHTPEQGQWRWSKERSYQAIKNYQRMLAETGQEENVPVTTEIVDEWYAKQGEDIDLLRQSATGKAEHYIAPTDSVVLNNSWMDLLVGSSHEINQLFDTKVFETAKLTETIKRMLGFVDKDALILDFFSGSATTAHAVMQLNAEDGGHRKFIMVQLPEATDEGGTAYRAGYRNICEIGKERIRRAGAKIAAAACEKAAGLDLGFRCLRLDTSNMTDVYYAPDAVTQDGLFAQVDNVKADRTPEDLLVQTMLDLGILLSASITVEEIAGKRVFNVADGFLLACFDRAVTDETVTAIAKRKPSYAVFRDASMADDSALTNFDQLFAAYSPATVRKVL
ncbi:MAG: site-specific DNA-methyltransferase [Selenomonas noxia]